MASSYFSEPGWNTFDCLTFLVASCIVVLRAYRLLSLDENMEAAISEQGGLLDNLVPPGSEYAVQGLLFPSQALLIIMFTIRIFKYFAFVQSTGFFTATLERAKGDLIPFSLIFMLILAGYTTAAYFFFGRADRKFMFWSRAFIAMFLYTTGELGFVDHFETSNVDTTGGIFPFLFFLTFILVVYFVLINIFLAVVVGAYDQGYLFFSNAGIKTCHSFESQNPKSTGELIPQMKTNITIPFIW